MCVQALWDRDSVLLQLPHITKEIAAKCAAAETLALALTLTLTLALALALALTLTLALALALALTLTRCAAAECESVYDLMDLEDAERNELLAGLSSAQAAPKL